MTPVRHRGRWTPADREEARYRYLPFEVTAADEGISVELAHDRADGAVIDLGLQGPGGWRGWSGGARSGFVVSADGATPGYLSGPLEEGSWQVVLGLHRVPAGGVGFEVTVEVGRVRLPPTAPPPRVPERPPPRDLPARPGHRWLAADLHCHTVHSDGTLRPVDLACQAVAVGLDLLAVTDHNTVSHHAALPAAAAHAGIALLAGQEVTTAEGHANAFGDVGWVDFREPADSWQAAVDECAGLLSLNHPARGDCAWRLPLSRMPTCVEAFHSTWLDDPPDHGALHWWTDQAPQAAPLGGSDFHRPGAGVRIGTPTTWLECVDGDPAAALEAMASGRTSVSVGPRAAVLLRVDDGILVIDGEGAVLFDGESGVHLISGPLERLPELVGPLVLRTPPGAPLALTA